MPALSATYAVFDVEPSLAFWFGHLVADDASHSRTCCRTQQAPANDVAGYATDGCACGGPFFLLRHASAATQGYCSEQDECGENRIALR